MAASIRRVVLVLSYGSGCCSEFYSGAVNRDGQLRPQRFEIARRLDERYRLSIDEYESILHNSVSVRFGVRNIELDTDFVGGALTSARGKGRLYLRRIREFHRQYEWLP